MKGGLLGGWAAFTFSRAVGTFTSWGRRPLEEITGDGAEGFVVQGVGVRPVAPFDGGQQRLDGAGPGLAQVTNEEAVQIARRAPPLLLPGRRGVVAGELVRGVTMGRGREDL